MRSGASFRCRSASAAARHDAEAFEQSLMELLNGPERNQCEGDALFRPAGLSTGYGWCKPCARAHGWEHQRSDHSLELPPPSNVDVDIPSLVEPLVISLLTQTISVCSGLVDGTMLQNITSKSVVLRSPL